VLVLPSLWPENSPLVVREATATGLRVIASSVGGAKALAPEARLVPPDDPDALVDALHQEVERGRGRAPRATWSSPGEHAQWLLLHHPRGDEASPGD